MDDTKENEMTPERMRPIIFGRRFDWTITIAILVLAIGFIYMLQSLPERATFFPWFITITIVIIGGVYSYGKIQKPGCWDDQYDPEADTDYGERDTGPAFLLENQRGIIRTLIIFCALIVATVLIGPEFAVPLFVMIMLGTSGESKVAAVLSGLGFWLVVHFVFGDFMSINLPTGYLVELFQ